MSSAAVPHLHSGAHSTEPNNQQNQLRAASTTSSITNQRRLFQVMSLGQGNSRGTWGITIVQIDYGLTGELIHDAAACIHDAVRRDLGAGRTFLERQHISSARGTTGKRNQHHRNQRENNVTAGDQIYARYSPEWIANKDLQDASVDKLSAIRLDRPRHQGPWDRQAQVKIKVLDAQPGTECIGIYEVHLGGERGLVDFWFARSLSRPPIETLLTPPPQPQRDDQLLWCYWPREKSKMTGHGKKGTRGQARLKGKRKRKDKDKTPVPK
ncbi:hypothetical protein NQ176_g10383 [Zarea fungicola]|uniref:Uncharacterized protein n=1 Tax=Zarea fungicola TaxID=93591 RepID=A0ACC1MHC6_9HYPO|nr:hypothetical protein NQ176_g10383 [Lecanicillium fungicola]